MADHADHSQELAAIAARLPALAALDGPALEAEYVALLGRKQGRLTEFLKTVLPVLPADAKRTVAELEHHGERAWVIGEVTAGDGAVVIDP